MVAPPGAAGDSGLHLRDLRPALRVHDRLRLREVLRRGTDPVQLCRHFVRRQDVAVEREVVRLLDHRRRRVVGPAETRRDGERMVRADLDAADQLPDLVLPEVRVVDPRDAALVAHLEEDVRVAVVDDEVRDPVHGRDDARVGRDPLVLEPVEERHVDDDPVRVGRADHLVEPGHPGRFQRSVGLERGDDLRMRDRGIPVVGVWQASLEADRHHVQPVRSVRRQHRDELVGVALRIPDSGVGIGPAAHRLRVVVVEDRVRHPGVEKQAADLPARIGHGAVDREPGPADPDHRGGRRGGLGGNAGHSGEEREDGRPSEETRACSQSSSPSSPPQPTSRALRVDGLPVRTTRI